MGIEIQQHASGSLKLVDDQTGNNCAFVDPNSRLLSVIRFAITRTSTFGQQMGVLPAGAVPTSLKVFTGTKSDSSTTASIIVGIDTTTNYLLGGWDTAQAANSGQQFPQKAANLHVALATPGPLPGGYHPVTAAYAETSTSTTGGPFYIEIGFYQPIPA